jgi:hypothetical protein
VSPDELLNLALLVLTIGGLGYWISDTRARLMMEIERLQKELADTDNIAENHNERIGELEAWRAKRAKKKRKAERGVPSQ